MVLFARITSILGIPVTRSSLSGIMLVLTDVQANVQTLLMPAILTTVSDNLIQNDPRWQADSALNPGFAGQWGYNWNYVLPAIYLPNIGDTYTARATFSFPSGQQPCVAVFEFVTF